MVKDEFQSQFHQTWKIFEAIVQGFDDHSWSHSGCGYMTPAKVAIHILLSVEYYIEHKSSWSNGLDPESQTTATETAASRQDIFASKMNSNSRPGGGCLR